MDRLRQIADAVLYEGYLLWPYRRSAMKNRQRWTFGGVYPQQWSTDHGGDDPCLMRTQCLVRAGVRVEVCVRFLQVVRRDEARPAGEPAWEESIEREVCTAGPAGRVDIDIPAGEDAQRPAGHNGRSAEVAVIRRWEAIRGHVVVHTEPVGPDLARVTVTITNTTPWRGDDRPEALRRTMVSTHTILRAADDSFVSLLEPPDDLRDAAAQCHNIGTWPVLVGEPGERHTVLSSPIILYDYPRVAPESPGDLFDNAEIDQLLTLNVLTLTDAEQAEMRDTDPRAAAILDRCLSMSPEQFMRLHGTMRDIRVSTLEGEP